MLHLFRFFFVSYQMEILLKPLLLGLDRNDEIISSTSCGKAKIDNARLTLTFESDRELTKQFTIGI